MLGIFSSICLISGSWISTFSVKSPGNGLDFSDALGISHPSICAKFIPLLSLKAVYDFDLHVSLVLGSQKTTWSLYIPYATIHLDLQSATTFALTSRVGSLLPAIAASCTSAGVPIMRK